MTTISFNENIQLLEVRVESIESRERRGKDISHSKPELQQLSEEISQTINNSLLYAYPEQTVTLLLNLSDRVNDLTKKASKSITKTDGPSLFLNLPHELILHVFSFLSAKNLVDTGCSSSSLYMLIKDQGLWKNLCQKEKELLLEEKEIPANSVSNIDWKERYKTWYSYFSKQEIKLGDTMAFCKDNDGKTLTIVYDKQKTTILDVRKFYCYKKKLRRKEIADVIVTNSIFSKMLDDNEKFDKINPQMNNPLVFKGRCWTKN